MSREAPPEVFVDRDASIEAFSGLVFSNIRVDVPVLAFYGVGGIGKTVVLRRLAELLDAANRVVPYAIYRPQAFNPSPDSPIRALINWRTQLGDEYKIPFHEFDLALVIMTARGGGGPPAFLDSRGWVSELAKVVLQFVGVPTVDGAKLRRLIGKHKKLTAFLRRVGGTELVLELVHLDDDELFDRILALFVRALETNDELERNVGVSRVLFLDGYETLWLGREGGSSEQARMVDNWVRTLAEALARVGVLLVIGSRDRLQWARWDRRWRNKIRQHEIRGFTEQAAREFLRRSVGMDDGLLVDAVLESCREERPNDVRPRYHPLYLELSAQTIINQRKLRRVIRPDHFKIGGSSDVLTELTRRFLRSLDSQRLELWLGELSLTPHFTEEAALELDRQRHHNNSRAGWERLNSFSFIETEDEDGEFFRINPTMRACLQPLVTTKADVHRWFEQYWREEDESSLEYYHIWANDALFALEHWSEEFDKATHDENSPRLRQLLNPFRFIDVRALQHEASEVAGQANYALGRALWLARTSERSRTLSLAIVYLKRSLRYWTRASFRYEWARSRHALGLAYSDLPTGSLDSNLEEAERHYVAARRAWTRRDNPVDWGRATNALANAIRRRATLQEGRADLLDLAVRRYRSALMVLTRSEWPDDWAMVQNNLGLANRGLVDRDGSKARQRALECFSNALTVWTREKAPEDWAAAQNNIATIYLDLEDAEGAYGEFASQAIDHLENALEALSRDTSPDDWATVHFNLGEAHLAVANSAADHTSSLTTAIGHFETSLEIWLKYEYPAKWKATQEALTECHDRVRGRPAP